MYCSDYEATNCGVKLCCYDCNNKQCEKNVNSKKMDAIICVPQNQILTDE